MFWSEFHGNQHIQTKYHRKTKFYYSKRKSHEKLLYKRMSRCFVLKVHQIDYEDKCSWKCKLQGQVSYCSSQKVGRKAVHSRRPFLDQHSPLLRECENCIVERVESPENRKEKEQGNLHYTYNSTPYQSLLRGIVYKKNAAK